MANFDEMSGIKQWAALVGVALVISAALYFTMFKSQREANAAGADQPGCQAPRKRRTGILPAQAGRDRAPAGQPQAAAGDRAQDRSG